MTRSALTLAVLVALLNAPRASAQVRTPTSGATNVALAPTLSVTPLGTDTPKDWYFGTSSNPPKVRALETSDTFSPGLLKASTTYYWRVDAHVGSDIYTGVRWSFRTGTAPVVVASPDGATVPPLARLVDGGLNVWALGTTIYQVEGYFNVLRNGADTGGGSNRLVACSGTVYHHGTDGNFYRWDGASWFVSAGPTQPCGPVNVTYDVPANVAYRLAAGSDCVVPDGFRAYLDGTRVADLPSATVCSQSVVTMQMAGVTAGLHTAMIGAYNVAGEARSQPFTFRAGP